MLSCTRNVVRKYAAPGHGVTPGLPRAAKPALEARRCVCVAARNDEFFSRPNRLFETRSWVEQARLRQDGSTGVPGSTVYTVRITTANGRGSGLSDLHSGVQLCLLGANGDAILHYISQVETNARSEDVMAEICEIVGPDAGAACNWSPKPLPEGAAAEGAAPTAVRRFQPGSVDEAHFVGPDVGALAKLLIGPLAGSWAVEEVLVSNSRTHTTHRFVCREKLGASSGEAGAACLAPIPPGAVVYGSGPSAVLLTAEQAESMRKQSLEQYAELKTRAIGTSAALMVAGLSAATLSGGKEYALAYLLGSIFGLAYQVLLYRRVDGAGRGLLDRQGSRGGGVRFGYGARLARQFQEAVRGTGSRSRSGAAELVRPTWQAFTSVVLVGGVVGLGMWNEWTPEDEEVHRLSLMFTSALGFFACKISLVAAQLEPGATRQGKSKGETLMREL